MNKPNEIRLAVLKSYAAWTATAALRSGKHLKDGFSLQKALEEVISLDAIPTTQNEFDEWHKLNVLVLQKKVLTLRSTETDEMQVTDFSIGWSAKLLNVYLKTLFYVGDLQPSTIRRLIHPPIDNILIDAIIVEFGVSIWNSDKKFTIQGIQNYEDYSNMIDRIKQIAHEAEFENLIDIEHVWTSIKKKYTDKVKYKLHEAMVEALSKMPDKQGSFMAVAKYINENGTYIRKDGIPVPAFQIKLRAFMSKGKYNAMFERSGEEGLKLSNDTFPRRKLK